MYQYLGNTEILMYSFFNELAVVAVFLFNFAFFKQKLALPSKLSEVYNTYITNKNVPAFLKSAYFIPVIELIIISYSYVYSRPFTGILGSYVGTGANYYGILFIAPLFLQLWLAIFSINPLKQLDLATPAFPLALVFGKLACFFQGCCRGVESEFGMYNHSSKLVEFPTQLLESVFALIIFIILLCIRKKVKEGTLYPIYIILYSATRFFSEFTRNEADVFLIFKAYHFLCIIGILVGIAQYIIIKNNKEKILQFYDRSCHILIDFIYVVYEGFFTKKGKLSHNKKKKSKKHVARKQLSDVKFDFQKVRMWILIWILGLLIQIGWNAESTWFNTFVYAKIDKNPSIITPMLILGALASTVSIFLFGYLTDKTGNRRSLISCGYIVWGLLIMLFSTTQFIAKSYLSLAIVGVVLGDMFVSFFGSMSSDVGYSTWLTDIMNDTNRGQIGAAIAIQSVLGAILGNVLGGKLVGSTNNYIRLFLVFGALLILAGILSTRIFDKNDDIKVFQKKLSEKNLNKFTAKNIFEYKELLWIYISIVFFFIGFNTYSPYIGNFIIYYLGYSAEQMGIIQVVPSLFAMMVTLPVSKYINNNKFIEVSLLSILSGVVGMLFVLLINPDAINTKTTFNVIIFMAIFFLTVSYVVMLQATKVWTKKLAPANSKGRFEVFYAIAFALIPMSFGTIISENIIKTTPQDNLIDLAGQIDYIPDSKIFVIGVLISSLSIIPILITKKYSKKRLNTINTDISQN